MLNTHPVSFDDNMSEVIVPSILDDHPDSDSDRDSIDDLLDFVSENLGLDSVPDDHSVQGDDIVGPTNESFDFVGFESKNPQNYSSVLNKGHYVPINDVKVPAQPTLDVCPKRALRPSRRPMDDQFDWDH